MPNAGPSKIYIQIHYILYISSYNCKCDLILKTKAFTDVIKLRKGDHSGVR